MKNISAWITLVITPLLVILIPVFGKWMKKKEAERKIKLEKQVQEGEQKINEFKVINDANRIFRQDLEAEIKRLRFEKSELEKEVNVKEEVIRELTRQIHEKEQELKRFRKKYGGDNNY